MACSAGDAWYRLVVARMPNRIEHRPCMLCGDTRSAVRKTLPVETMLSHLDKCVPYCQEHSFWITHENLCRSAIVLQQQCGVKTFSETISICLSCSHWTQRRKKVQVPPLLELKWHLRTMIPVNKKRLDKRVIHRLAGVLSQPNNFYRTMFTAKELDCLAEVFHGSPKDVNVPIARLYERQNAHSLFVWNSNVAELMRLAA